MENIEVSVGGRDVIAAGTVQTRGDEDIVLLLRGLKFVLTFRSTDAKETNVTGNLGDKSLVLNLENFDNSLGISYWGIVGTVDRRELTLDLFIHSVGEPNKNRLVSYSFSLGGVASNG